LLALAVLLADLGRAQVTQRLSVDSAGLQGNNPSFYPSVSADGRYVAFSSFASNLVPGDTNGPFGIDVLVRDRTTGVTERVSVDSGGIEGDDQSFEAAISADGRFVAFGSRATNLVPGDANGFNDIFVHDRQTQATERVSLSSAGAEGDDYSAAPSISADGRYVAFVSYASNLVAGDTNGFPDVFVRDRQSGTTSVISLIGAPQTPSDVFDMDVSISADGLWVAFSTSANEQVPGDTDLEADVFIRDLSGGPIECVGVGSGGVQADGWSVSPALSSDGRFVVFSSLAENLVAGDTNGVWDVFVRDRLAGTTERVSTGSAGVEGNAQSYESSISADGRWVAFTSLASNLVPDDTNGLEDVFVRDRQAGTTGRVSLDSTGAEAELQSVSPSVSADGRYVAFDSPAANLVPRDTNNVHDVFLRDREQSGFASLCSPGLSGVVTCPCANPPSGPDRGCDNSSGTGGASLSAWGGAYLSSDSLLFETSGEKPVALSIVMQGTTSPAAGILYGQGVRCVGGSLKRLFAKAAAAGSITAPDFGAGDPTVSARSAAKGDSIQAGQSRWYLVFYRDPVVLAGCPPTSTFNATQTVAVPWLP